MVKVHDCEYDGCLSISCSIIGTEVAKTFTGRTFP
jgi:hypothetical protein